MFENAGSKAYAIVKVYVVIVMIATLIIGIIFSIQGATVVSNISNMYSYYGYGNYYEKEFNFGLFLLYLLVVALIMFFEYVTGIIMIAFCEMMSDVHDLRDKFIIESDQKYNNRGVLISDEDRNRDIIAKGGWKCAGCGKVHPSYETSCVCGMLKSNN